MGQNLNYASNIVRVEWPCAECGAKPPILCTEEVVSFRIVQPQVVAGTLYFYEVQDETGKFTFDPYVFHFECWEDLIEIIKDTTKDEPPIPDTYRSTLQCSNCESGVRDWEYVGVYTIGEFHVSQRTPNGETTPKFHENGKPTVLCLSCIYIANQESLEMWPDLSQNGECADCTHTRCWRQPSCDCACHTEQPEEQQ